ncbi:MAG: hypothetical protein KGH72_00005 [Candidatus Micrarchaeota archaeon]|nr:hypothetical protein [Candidatus Micrarchaeota archaeon]
MAGAFGGVNPKEETVLRDINDSIKRLNETSGRIEVYSKRLDILTISLILMTGILLAVNIPIMFNAIFNIELLTSNSIGLAIEIIGFIVGFFFVFLTIWQLRKGI